MKTSRRKSGSSLLLLAVAVTLWRLALGAGVAVGLSLTGCPEKCGDVAIPFPFGIGEKCSLPGFELQCNRTSTGELLPLMRISSTGNPAPVVNISLLPTQVSILMHPFSSCSLPVTTQSSLSSLFMDLYNRPFALSSTDNLLTVVGCNTLAYMKTGPVGCVSMCPNVSGDISDKDKCSGIGCCQVSIPRGYYTLNLHIYMVSLSLAQLPCTALRCRAIDTSGSATNCGSAILSRKGSYSFTKEDGQTDMSNRTYPIVLDWFIRTQHNPQTCARAQVDMTTYACRSNHSACFNTPTGFGYYCKCSEGFRGNPYLLNGCHDICEDPQTCKGGRECSHRIGGYSCECPNGTLDYGSNHPCVPIDKNVNYKKSNKTTFGIALGFLIALMILLIVGGCIITYKKVEKRRLEQHKQRLFKKNYDLLLRQQVISDMGEDIVERIKFFPIFDLAKATNYFDKSCIVGKGGHGTVYKGLLNLRVVAIKMSNVTTEWETEQFINEILLLSQINHRNVVKLIGCCLENEVPLLVYEFISNGTLYDHLHSRNQESLLSWGDRLRIATEITSALVYLHSAANVSIFHRDIKTSNILLDEKLSARISDFGASKSIASNETHVSTNVQGTWAYLDPQYLQTGQLTEKTDVYSLAVILVELLTGQNPTSAAGSQEERTLISSFMLSMKENKLFEVIEPSIIEQKNGKEIETLARLAIASLSINGKDRPTMKNLLATLEDLMDKDKNEYMMKKTSKNYYEIECNLIDMFVPSGSGVNTTNGKEIHSLLKGSPPL